MNDNFTQVLGTVAMVPKGEYDSETFYDYLNIVNYEGGSYVAKTSVNGVEPTNTEYWQYLAGGAIKKVNTIEEMLADESLMDGMVVQTLGYYSVNDGGAAVYEIKNGTADNFFSYELTNGKIAELMNKNEFNVLQVGAKRNIDFDNASIFSKIFKNGLNDTTVYVPAGVYQTTTINYTGENQETNNFNFIGINNPVIKLIHPDLTKTVQETYSDDYYVSKFIDTITTGNDFELATIKLANNKIYHYIKVDDSTLLPDSLVNGLVICGVESGCKAVISKIDKSNPDGEGTARIYLYETHNDITKESVFKNSSNTINENLGIREDLSDSYLYIRFDDNVIPSSVQLNRQIEQISNGHKARVNKITTVYEGTNFIKLDCMPEEDIFTDNSLYLIDSTPFNVNTYSNFTAGMLSINKYTNSKIRGIVFDGGNLEVSRYEVNNNSWNSIITGGCKNIEITDCEFKNTIMAGLQIGGANNVYSAESHDYPENISVRNCHFYNNGRGDIEVIHGKNINIVECSGNGTLDVENNSNEILDNINIDKCNFYSTTPYSPATIHSSCFINISNSEFFTLLAQGRICLNLSNVKAHQLQPQVVNIKGTNCEFNLINGVHGNECLELTNSCFLGLYQNNPGGQYGDTKFILNNSIIDLSLSLDNLNNRFYNMEKVKLTNCLVTSKTTLNIINDNKSYYECYNTDFKNIRIYGGAATESTFGYKSIFDSCRFLSVDNTTTTSENTLAANIYSGFIKNCYIETNIQFNNTSFHFINCVLNHNTKARLRTNRNPYYTGIVSDDGNGISWQWVETGSADHPLKFDNIQFSKDIVSNLGVKNGVVAVNASSVSQGCRGYYVGDTDKALVKIYHNGTSLGLKEISFT